MAVIPSNYTMDVSWDIPTEPNGVITSYTVKWCQSDRVMNYVGDPGVRTCDSTDTALSTSFTIPDLDAYTNYNISVLASTKIGPGPPVHRYIPTTAGSIKHLLLVYMNGSFCRYNICSSYIMFD